MRIAKLPGSLAGTPTVVTIIASRSVRGARAWDALRGFTLLVSAAHFPRRIQGKAGWCTGIGITEQAFQALSGKRACLAGSFVGGAEIVRGKLAKSPFSASSVGTLFPNAWQRLAGLVAGAVGAIKAFEIKETALSGCECALPKINVTSLCCRERLC
ncbi:MAG: hypothetical protein GY811_27570 [Myxococcales bacterium]|nr:hypothetical protein [Myxococcales bacterium]